MLLQIYLNLCSFNDFRNSYFNFKDLTLLYFPLHEHIANSHATNISCITMFRSITFIMTCVYINVIHTEPTTILGLHFSLFFWYKFIVLKVNNDLILFNLYILITNSAPNFPT